MSRLPDFIIIGAMKCATSTLHDQLAAQPGVFMSTPKEPCFFSDDDQWNRGLDWYSGLFADAKPGNQCGESSTHYTKLPTYPKTVERMYETLGDSVRIVYMMRHPIDRLISQFIHEWSEGVIAAGVTIDEAIDQHTELIDYSRYAHQLQPFREAFGVDAICPVFFERFVAQPADELRRIGAFLQLPAPLTWVEDLGQRNVSNERMRRSSVRDTIFALPGVRPFVRAVVPQDKRHQIMRKWSMQQRPELLPATRALLESAYDDDLAMLSEWLGVTINCKNFKDIATTTTMTWQRKHTGAAL